MAASACFVPAPAAHAPAPPACGPARAPALGSGTRAAAPLLLGCWIASGFATGFVLAVGSRPTPAAASTVVARPGPMPHVERLPGRATFYRPAGSRAERPVFAKGGRVYRPALSVAFANSAFVPR